MESGNEESNTKTILQLNEEEWSKFFKLKPSPEKSQCNYYFLYNFLTGYESQEEAMIDDVCMLCTEQGKQKAEENLEDNNYRCKSYDHTVDFDKTYDFYNESRQINNKFSNLNYNIFKIHNTSFYNDGEINNMRKGILEKAGLLSVDQLLNKSSELNFNITNTDLKNRICDKILDDMILAQDFDGLINFLNSKDNTGVLFVMSNFLQTFQTTFYVFPELSPETEKKYKERINELIKYLTSKGVSVIKADENFGYFYQYLYVRLLKPVLLLSFRDLSLSALNSLNSIDRFITFNIPIHNGNVCKQENIDLMEKLVLVLCDHIKSMEFEVRALTLIFLEIVKNCMKYNLFSQVTNSILMKELLNYTNEESSMSPSIMINLLKTVNYFYLHKNDRVTYRKSFSIYIQDLTKEGVPPETIKKAQDYHLKYIGENETGTWSFNSDDQLDNQVAKLFLSIVSRNTVLLTNKITSSESNTELDLIWSIFSFLYLRNTNSENFYVNSLLSSQYKSITPILEEKQRISPLDKEVAAFTVLNNLYNELKIDFTSYIGMVSQLLHLIKGKIPEVYSKKEITGADITSMVHENDDEILYIKMPKCTEIFGGNFYGVFDQFFYYYNKYKQFYFQKCKDSSEHISFFKKDEIKIICLLFYYVSGNIENLPKISSINSYFMTEVFSEDPESLLQFFFHFNIQYFEVNKHTLLTDNYFVMSVFSCLLRNHIEKLLVMERFKQLVLLLIPMIQLANSLIVDFSLKNRIAIKPIMQLLNFFTKLKGTDKFMSLVNAFVLNPKEFDSDVVDQKTIRTFVLEVMKIYDELISNDWYFMNLVNESHFIFDFDFLINKLKDVKYGPPMQIRYKKLATMLVLSPLYNINHSEQSLLSLYNCTRVDTNPYMLQDDNFTLNTMVYKLFTDDQLKHQQNLTDNIYYETVINQKPSAIEEEGITFKSLFESKIEYVKSCFDRIVDIYSSISKLKFKLQSRIISGYIYNIIIIPTRVIMYQLYSNKNRITGKELALFYELVLSAVDQIHQSLTILIQRKAEDDSDQKSKYSYREDTKWKFNPDSNVEIVGQILKDLKATNPLYHKKVIQLFNRICDEVIILNHRNMKKDSDKPSPGALLAEMYLTEMERADQKNKLSIMNHLGDNFKNDRNYLTSIFTIVFCGIDKDFLKVERKSNVRRASANESVIMKHNFDPIPEEDKAENDKEDEEVKVNEVVQEEVGESGTDGLNENIVLIEDNQDHHSLKQIKFTKPNHEIDDNNGKVPEQKKPSLEESIAELKKISTSFPFSECINSYQNGEKNIVTFINSNNISIVNSLLTYNQSLFQEFTSIFFQSNPEYLSNFLKNIVSHSIFPSIIYILHKSFNPSYIDNDHSIAIEQFDLLMKFLLSYCNGPSKGIIIDILFNIDYKDDLIKIKDKFGHLKGNLELIFEDPIMEQLCNRSYSLFNLLCNMIFVCLENLKKTLEINCQKAPSLFLSHLSKRTESIIRKLMNVIIKMLSIEMTEDLKPYFECPIPGYLKTGKNNLKNELILNHFPFLRILERIESILNNNEIDELLKLRNSITKLLHSLIEETNSTYYREKFTFYFRVNSLIYQAKESLKRSYNKINHLGKPEEVSEITSNVLIDILKSIDPKKIIDYYKNENFELYINLMIFASYMSNSFDLYTLNYFKVASSFVFIQKKREKLFNPELIKDVLKADNISFGISDIDENLSIFFSLVIYCVLERKVEYVYQDNLLLKVFVMTPETYICLHYKQKEVKSENAPRKSKKSGRKSDLAKIAQANIDDPQTLQQLEPLNSEENIEEEEEAQLIQTPIEDINGFSSQLEFDIQSLSLSQPNGFSRAELESDIDISVHPDRLEKLISIIRSYYRYDRLLSVKKQKTGISENLKTDIQIGQRLSYIITIILILFSFLFVKEINNLTFFQKSFINLLSLTQLILLLSNLYFYTKSKLEEETDDTDKQVPFTIFRVTIPSKVILILEDSSSVLLYLVLALSALLLQYKVIFIIIQLFYLCIFSDTVLSIYQAFLGKYYQLLTLLFVVFISITSLATFGFFGYKDEFIINTEGAGQINVCNSLMSCILFYFNYGLRSGGGIGDQLPVRFIEQPMFWLRFVMDIAFYIILILLLLNMINGIIISSFTEYRERSEERADVKANKCFICNLHKHDFEVKKMSFTRHIEHEHNVFNYFIYVTYLKKINPNKLSVEEKAFLNSIQDSEITIFPQETGFRYKRNSVDVVA